MDNASIAHTRRRIRPFHDADEAQVVGVWHRSGLAAYPYLPIWQAMTLERAQWVFHNIIRAQCAIWVGILDEQIVAYLAMNGSYIDRLYGPPAVGKLTIAKELARLTGFKLFHAHLTSDVVEAIFPRGTPSFRTLAWDLRYAVFAEAAQAHLDGLIFTTVYGRGYREQFIARCVEVVAPFGGEVCFVHVHCQAETLRQRVVREDRQQYGKITSVELLNATLRHGEPQGLFEAAPLWDSLSLNTDVLRPVEAAQQVIAHYRLPTKQHNLTPHQTV